MPELPEVEVIVRELRPQLTGQRIQSVTVFWERTFINDSQTVIENRDIQKVTRHGKFIIFELDQGQILTHLRMTGRYMYCNPDEKAATHLRLFFEFDSGDKLYFYDTRKFGRIVFTDTPAKYLQNFGTDALADEFTVTYFKDQLGRTRQKIKAFLLNQKQVAGVGNIYADESLFRSGIHPNRPADSLSTSEAGRLFKALREILLNAIGNMGTTISDYRTTGGGFGSNQNYLKVYGRSGEACYKCGTVISKSKVAGRGTHFCPKCQSMQGIE